VPDLPKLPNLKSPSVPLTFQAPEQKIVGKKFFALVRAREECDPTPIVSPSTSANFHDGKAACQRP
jgi:hypothetical protein